MSLPLSHKSRTDVNAMDASLGKRRRGENVEYSVGVRQNVGRYLEITVTPTTSVEQQSRLCKKTDLKANREIEKNQFKSTLVSLVCLLRGWVGWGFDWGLWDVDCSVKLVPCCPFLVCFGVFGVVCVMVGPWSLSWEAGSFGSLGHPHQGLATRSDGRSSAAIAWWSSFEQVPSAKSQVPSQVPVPGLGMYGQR